MRASLTMPHRGHSPLQPGIHSDIKGIAGSFSSQFNLLGFFCLCLHSYSTIKENFVKLLINQSQKLLKFLNETIIKHCSVFTFKQLQSCDYLQHLHK